MEKKFALNGVLKKHITEQSYMERTDIAEARVPEGITHIDAEALMGAAGLKRITIPDSVRIIDNRAFAGCSSLECVSLPPRMKIVSVGIFDGCTSLRYVRLPVCVEKIESRAFANCKSLRYLRIPSSAYSIGTDVFEGSDITVVLSKNSPLFGTMAKRGIRVITEDEFTALGIMEPAAEELAASDTAMLLEGGITKESKAQDNSEKLLEATRSVLLQYLSAGLVSEILDRIKTAAD